MHLILKWITIAFCHIMQYHEMDYHGHFIICIMKWITIAFYHMRYHEIDYYNISSCMHYHEMDYRNI